jgi:hypothetical protein
MNQSDHCQECGGSGMLPMGHGEQGSQPPCPMYNAEEVGRVLQKSKADLEAKMADTEEWP